MDLTGLKFIFVITLIQFVLLGLLFKEHVDLKRTVKEHNDIQWTAFFAATKRRWEHECVYHGVERSCTILNREYKLENHDPKYKYAPYYMPQLPKEH